MSILRPYLKDSQFLKELALSTIQEIYIKIEVLDMKEKPIKEIQGQVTAGQINIDGKSAVRRSGNVTFIPDLTQIDLTDARNLISINKKIRVEIGQKNTLYKYSEYNILWFPMGVYIITDVSKTRSIADESISIDFQDKMATLNGFSGGTLPAAIAFHEYEDGSKVPIYNIIQELVHHFGEEQLGKIIIEDIDLRVKKYVRWIGEGTLSFMQSEFDPKRFVIYEGELEGASYVFNQYEDIGFQYTDFTFPGELVGDQGQAITDVLDKIKNTLGNYEYFYDLDGNFRFQEIRNFLNTSMANFILEEDEKAAYSVDYSRKDTIPYDFSDQNLLISISNTPSYENVKNDFVVWGVRDSVEGEKLPIRFHLSIDEKPLPTETKVVGEEIKTENWRNVLYRQGQNSESLALFSNFYYPALVNEWPKLYDIESYEWKAEALANPSGLDYYLDFIDTPGPINELNIQNIGRRSLVIEDESINCLFTPEVPDIIIAVEGTGADQEAISKGDAYAILPYDLL